MAEHLPKDFDLARWARELVADWPPLTAEQRAVIRSLRQPGAEARKRAA